MVEGTGLQETSILAFVLTYLEGPQAFLEAILISRYSILVAPVLFDLVAIVVL
jgi:hypothetical protein